MKITRLPIHPAWRTTTVGIQLGCAYGSTARVFDASQVFDANHRALPSRPGCLAMPHGNA